MEKYDIPPTVRAILSTALEVEALRPLDLYALGVTYADDWGALVQDVVASVESLRHYNKEGHSAVIAEANKFWKELHRVTGEAINDI